MKKLFSLVLLAALASLIIACQGAPDESAIEAPRIEAADIAAVLETADLFILDVRRPDEIEERGTLRGYTNIHIDELADRLGELPRDRPILAL